MRFVLVAIIGLVSFQASAENKCATFTTPVPWSYCVTVDPQSTSDEVLYFLHGGGGGQMDDMKSYTFDTLRADWKSLKHQSPRIVQVTFGPYWALVPKDSNPDSGLFEVFTQTVMPKIEATEFGSKVGRRLIWGHSMGGLNGSILAMLVPNMFSKIAMTSPAPLLGISPFSTDQEIQDYAKKAGSELDVIQSIVGQYRWFMGSTETYNKISVLASGANNLNAKTPAMYISGSDKDTAAYIFGIKAFLAIAREAGVSVNWESRPDGHGDIDEAALAAFLAN